MRVTAATLAAMFVLIPPVGAEQPDVPAPEDPVRLPEITVSAPARLPGSPLPLSSVPAPVQVISGDELRSSGVTTLQEALTRLPGVTLSDQQGNSFQTSPSAASRPRR